MTGNETGVHCKTTFKTSRRQMMLGLCRSSSRYSQCVQGCLVWTICARARLEALTEANEQDPCRTTTAQIPRCCFRVTLAQHRRVNSQAWTDWWMPSQLVTWVVSEGSCDNEGSSMFVASPHVLAWPAENSTNLGSRCYEVVKWSIHGLLWLQQLRTGWNIGSWIFLRDPITGRRTRESSGFEPNPVAKPERGDEKGNMRGMKGIKMPFAASGIDFQSLCWNLHSLCLVSFLRLIYFQHQCHSPFSTCHGMSRHYASMCFTSPHRLIFDLTPNMWYMWYICTFSALLMCFEGTIDVFGSGAIRLGGASVTA